MALRSVALLLVAVLATSSALHKLVPEGKELVYQYHGLVRAGANQPTSFASAFVLDGKLRMQTDANATLLQFADLKYKLYNGKYDEWHEFQTTEIPLPKELEALKGAFKVVHDASGRAIGIVTEEGDPEYVVNIKRAMGNIMQLNTEKLDLQKTKPYVFKAREYNMYGEGKVYYSVRFDNGGMVVEKMDEYHSTKHLYIHTVKNIDYDFCAAHYDEPSTRDSQKVYVINKQDGQHVVDKIESTGGVYYHPYLGRSDAFHIYLNQTFELESVKATEEPMKMASAKYHDKLMQNIAEMANIPGPIPDISHGRIVVNMDELLKEAEKLIEDIVEYLGEDRVKTEQPDFKKAVQVQLVIPVLHRMDLDTLNKLHDNLVGCTHKDAKQHLQVYYQLLPMLGTHAGYYQIRNLIGQKKVKDYHAISMLADMPASVKFPNKQLMDEMSKIIYWGDEISKPVRRMAALAFGTMLQKATDRHYRYAFKNIWWQHSHEHFEDHRDDLKLEEAYPGEKYYEKYLVEFVKRIKEGKDYDTIATYFEALYNTKMPSVLPLLAPAVRGEWNNEDSYVMLAAYAAFPGAARDTDALIELYWPILSDTTRSVALRAMVYKLIMNTQPPMSRLINIYWLMEGEKSSAMYLFHYRFMQALSRTTDPCKNVLRRHVSEILAYTYEPEYKGLTGYYQIDYFNEEYGFGGALNWMLIHAPREGELVFATSIVENRDTYLTNTPHSLFVRIAGLDRSILEGLKLDVTKPIYLFNVGDVVESLRKVPKLDGIQIAIVVSRYNQIKLAWHFDKTNIGEMALLFKTMPQFSHSSKTVRLDNLIDKNILLPTDIGFPVLWQQFVPEVTSFDYDVERKTVDHVDVYHISFLYSMWSVATEGPNLYNPIANVWQGVHKMRSYDNRLPLSLDVSINYRESTIKVSIKNKEGDGAAGERMHATTMVFVWPEGDEKVLQESCPKCNNFEIVSLGEHNRKGHQLKSQVMAFPGSRLDQAIFDSERYISRSYKGKYDLNSHTRLAKTPRMNSYYDLSELILTLMHACSLEYIQHEPYTSGQAIRITPLPDVTSFDLSFTFDSEYTKGDMFLLPGAKYDFGATFTLNSKDKAPQTWELKGVHEMNLGQTHNTLKVHLKGTLPIGDEIKICIDGVDDWDSESFKSVLSLSSSITGEGKCTKDDAVLELTFSGEMSEEQKEGNSTYSDCYERVWGEIHEQQTLECYMEHSSLRKYTLTLDTKELPEILDQSIEEGMVYVKSAFSEFFDGEDSASRKIAKNNIQFEVEFPMTEDVINMNVYTDEHDYIFSAIPEDEFIIGSTGMNLHYGNLFQSMHYFGLMDTCIVKRDQVDNINEEAVAFEMPGEWTMYLGDAEADAKHGVWVKKLEKDNAIAVRFVHAEHTLEIVPKDGVYQFFVDGKQLEKDDRHTEKWFHYQWVKETDVVSVMTYHFGLNVLYDGHHVQIEIPQVDYKYYGHCLDVNK